MAAILSLSFAGCKKNTQTPTDLTFIKDLGGPVLGNGIVGLYEEPSGNMVMYGNCLPYANVGQGTLVHSNYVSTLDQFGNLLNANGFDQAYSEACTFLHRFDGYYLTYGHAYLPTHIRRLDNNLNLIYDKALNFHDSLSSKSSFFPLKMIPANDGGWVIHYNLQDYGTSFQYAGILKMDSSFSKTKWNINLGPGTPYSMVSTMDGYIVAYLDDFGTQWLEKVDNHSNVVWKIVPDPAPGNIPLNLFALNNDSCLLIYEKQNHLNNYFANLAAVTVDHYGNTLNSYDLNTPVAVNSSYIGDAEMTADKGFIVTGARYGDLTNNMLLAKFDANLHKQWENVFFSGAGGTAGYKVFPLRNGYLVAAASFGFGKGLVVDSLKAVNMLYKTDLNGQVR